MLRNALTGILTFALIGCALVPRPRQMTEIHSPNPVIVRANNAEDLWENLADVVNDYHFQIAREDRLEGVIETEYKPGANVFEPWHADAANLHERLEGTFQSIRRRAIVRVQPTNAAGHFQIGIEVQKQLEDLSGLVANSPGDATFLENQPFDRDLQNVVGQTDPSVWIDRGTDPALEQSMLKHLHRVLPRECFLTEMQDRSGRNLRQ